MELDWTTACPDWADKLKRGESMLPAPLFPEVAEQAVQVFKDLKIVDAPGSPTFGESCAPWVFELVASLFGSYDPETGRRHINEVFVMIPKKNSKALCRSTLLPTPGGYTTMGEVQVGEYVLALDGTPTKVLAKSEIFTGRKCYEVEFSTGEKIVCDAQHLWMTDAHRDRANHWQDRKKPQPRVKTTEEIARTLSVPSGKYHINNHRTEIAAPLLLADAELTIPPYVLGVWLGDGYSAGARLCLAERDAREILAGIHATGHVAYILGKERSAYRVSLSDKAKKEDQEDAYFLKKARAMGLLEEKHIPVRYLRGSYAQRLALLRGLMDTDGSFSKAGQATYTTVLPRLRDDVMELVNSLGFKASWSVSEAKIGDKSYGDVYLIQFWPFNEVEVCTVPFKLERQRACPAKNKSRSKHRQIVAVREVESVPTQCLMVEHPSHQFLVGRSMIPTHNSTLAAGIMMTALLLNWRMSAEFTVLAPTIEVANNAYAPARDMAKFDEELDSLCQVQNHIRTITHRNTNASLKVVAADANTVSGKKSVGILIDEVWLMGKMPNAEDMLREATGGLASRPEGFVIYLTTQSNEPPAGVFKQKLEYARSVRDGKVQDRNFLPLIFEHPPEMVEAGDHLLLENMAMVNPNMGYSVDQPFLEREYRKAREQGEESFRGFMAKHANVEIGLRLRADRWPGADFWERQVLPQRVDLETLITECEVIDIGIDGGGLDDLLGFSAVGRNTKTRQWMAYCKAWAHESVLERRKSEISKLKDFEKSGDVRIIQHIGEDMAELASMVQAVYAADLLDKIGIDPAGVGTILDALVEIGIPEDKVVGISQGWKLGGAIKTTERKLAEGGLVHGGQALMAWCVGNARVEPRGNSILITKQASGSAKIDPLMALFNAVSLMALNPASCRKEFQIHFF